RRAVLQLQGDGSPLVARVLYFDCFSGIAGDMVGGAFLDAGLPLEDLKRALGSLALDGYDVSAERVLRAGVSATKFRVHEAAAAQDHQPSGEHDRERPHEHGHHDHSHHPGDQHHHEHHDHHHHDHHPHRSV